MIKEIKTFNAKLTKSKRRTSPSEGQIQKSILQFLRTIGICSWRINSVGIPDGKGGFRTNPEMNGIADIHSIIRIKGIGASVWFEVKSEKGRLSKHQQTFRKNVEEAGGYYFIVRSIDDVQQAIKQLGDLGNDNKANKVKKEMPAMRSRL